MTTRTEQAREYARSMRGRYREVSEEAGVTYWWLARFAQGGIKSPGSDKVDALLAHRDAGQAKAEVRKAS